MSRERLVNRQLNPLLETLPEWVKEYRPHQISAITEALALFDDVEVVVLDAPTGSGKTLIGETIRRMMREKAVYLCSSKSLQDQFLSDYPYAHVLKGKGNYPTELYPERFDPDDWQGHLSCDDCNEKKKKPCDWCADECPYQTAKSEATCSDIAVLNTSYFLHEENGWAPAFTRPLVIVDECDTLESQLMGYVSVEVSQRRVERFGWEPPPRVTVPETWIPWLAEKVQWLEEEKKRTYRKDKVLENREKRYLENLGEKLGRVLNDLQEDPENSWVYTGRERQGISFRPARVDNLGQEKLWYHAGRPVMRNGKVEIQRPGKWLLMSATVISAQEILDSLGYTGTWGVVRVPSTFPVANRRVTVTSIAKVSRKEQETAWPKIAKQVRRIVESEADTNVLVHSVSYALTRAIVEELSASGSPVITYSSAAGRESSLRQFRDKGGVLVAPSLDRGIDLPDDLCRVQIVCKVPFLNLGDRQVATRLHSRNGQLWYSVQAVRTLVQMCGRAVRHEGDWARTYILDSSFEEILWKQSKHLFPEWFKEGIEWSPNGSTGREAHAPTLGSAATTSTR